ncbi:hypothetical protein L1987_30014 [Smallanthus sonchifolius]|uniref:Uncharacterized protein n=1 Tax=Smallanthus sonchifolius TaxID=185202 RepID=A0ACB9I4A9_9ASTR|nr:hypothetical protein L1987_30014 [Smallanthus sonchifolius]
MLISTTTSNGGFNIGWSKGNASKVWLKVMGMKAKNATFISGTEAWKISMEIQKIILDVPTVGGRIMLVDMVRSELLTSWSNWT